MLRLIFPYIPDAGRITVQTFEMARRVPISTVAANFITSSAASLRLLKTGQNFTSLNRGLSHTCGEWPANSSNQQ